MRKRHKRKGSSEVNLGFQIAPMIDVVFVIMLFFMVMAGAVKVENAHNTKLPSFKEKIIIPSEETSIRIDDEGQVYLNDEALDTPAARALPELASSLTQLHEISVASNSKVFVTIDADERTHYQRVIDVLDALSLASISDVTFQAGSTE